MTPNLASSPRRNHLIAGFSLLLVLAMMLAACGGSGNGNTSTPTATRSSTLRILSSPGQTNPDLFNPFFDTNHGGDYGAQGLLFEELYFTNLYNGQPSPWLATSATYSPDLTVLTFKLRTDVKWNDGQPFTRVVDRTPATKLVSHSNRCLINVAAQGRKAVITAALDNLVKGASGQGVECFNIASGFERTTALEGPVQWP